MTTYPLNQKGYNYFPYEQLEKVQQLTISTLKLCLGKAKWPDGNFIMSLRKKDLSHILRTGSGLFQ